MLDSAQCRMRAKMKNIRGRKASLEDISLFFPGELLPRTSVVGLITAGTILSLIIPLMETKMSHLQEELLINMRWPDIDQDRLPKTEKVQDIVQRALIMSRIMLRKRGSKHCFLPTSRTTSTLLSSRLLSKQKTQI